MAYRRRRSSFFIGWLHYLFGEIRGILSIMAAIALVTFLVASLFVGMYQVAHSIVRAVLFG